MTILISDTFAMTLYNNILVYVFNGEMGFVVLAIFALFAAIAIFGRFPISLVLSFGIGLGLIISFMYGLIQPFLIIGFLTAGWFLLKGVIKTSPG